MTSTEPHDSYVINDREKRTVSRLAAWSKKLVRLSCWLSIWLSVLGCLSAGQSAAGQTLPTGEPLRQPAKAKDERLYPISLGAGEFLQVRVTEHGLQVS